MGIEDLALQTSQQALWMFWKNAILLRELQGFVFLFFLFPLLNEIKGMVETI